MGRITMNEKVTSAGLHRNAARVLDGFTMIEMLVVLVIAGILVSLVVPAVMKARGASSMAKCASNLRQIGVGVRTYLSEHNGIFPPEPPYGSLNGFLLTTMEGYYPEPSEYTSGMGGAAIPKGPVVKFWVCPSDPTHGGLNKYGALNGVAGDESQSGVNAHSYAANAYLFRRAIFEVSRPSQSILVADFPWSINGTRAIYPAGAPWMNMYPKDWHQEKINCLFVDGHVEPLLAKSLVWGQSNSKYWYPDYPSVIGMKPIP